MTVTRPVQTSFMEGMDRPVGPILPSVFHGSNADLMVAVAPLYLSGSVLDMAYGEGKWWRRFTPDPFTAHDLKTDGVDFTALPHPNGSFDAVCFDPPYVLSGGTSSAAGNVGGFQNAYGIGLQNGITGWAGLVDLVTAGLTEACRVSRGFVLVKCMEFVQDRFRDMPTLVTNHAAGLGCPLHDRIVHHTGSGPGGHNIFDVKRARRTHSYLLVFDATERDSSPPRDSGFDTSRVTVSGRHFAESDQ